MNIPLQISKALALWGITAACNSGGLQCEQLTPDTLKIWKDSITSADCAIESKQPFLWIDETPDRASRLRHGEILAAPLGRHGAERAADGLIHRWIGAVFIPRATLGELLSVVHDYNNYKEF